MRQLVDSGPGSTKDTPEPDSGVVPALSPAAPILDAIVDGVFALDAGGRITYANPAAARMTGWPVEELIGRQLHGCVHSSERRGRPCSPDACALLGALSDPGSPHVTSDLFWRQDGTAFPVRYTTAPLREGDPSAGLVVTCSDRTAHREADRRHRAQSEVTRVLVEDAPVQEMRERLLGAICESLGWSWGEFWEVEGRGSSELCCAAVWHNGNGPAAGIPTALDTRITPMDDTVLGRVCNSGVPEWSDLRNGCASGTTTAETGFQTILAFPVSFAGTVLGVMAFFARETVVPDTDLLETLAGIGRQLGEFTLRKHSEQALLRSQEQLRQSNKMEAIGTLAGGVAHDFNNMLAVITGYSDLLLLRPHLDADARSALDQIRSAADRAAGLTRQLLAFSRKQLLQPRLLDLVTLTVDMSRLLRRLIGEDVELVTAADPGPASVVADPSQLEQVVLNLVVNARDAMPTGGKLTIEVRKVTLDEEYARRHLDVDPGEYVMLAVSDTGCGMDRETLARIFEPFFTTKEAGKGTGLGLSTVFGVVKQTGGHVWAYSEPGRGSTFKIYLPRAEQGELIDRREAGTPEAGTGTLLVVEDEELLRTLTCDVLTQAGYRVLRAANGAEALQVAEEHAGRIDLVLTDVVMPIMSGRELSERLQAYRPGVPMLFMSGYTDDAVVRHGVLVAEAAFIQKPFSPYQLTQKVREVLRLGRSASKG